MPLNDLIAPGTVWLVGAGPGDPDLLTRKAERLIAAADIVFHDALIGPGVLAMVRSSTEKVSVGKRSGRHSKDQRGINDLLADAALAGRRVVRLKGGDPAIFGRSAEEIGHLRDRGIAVHVCPGVTTASAAAAAVGHALTVRGVSRGLTLITAHARAGEPLSLDWASLAVNGETLGVYMGRAAAPEIARALIAAGCDPEMPVLVAVNVSLPDERLIRGKLSALAFLVAAISDDDPTLLLIGEAFGEQQRPPTAQPAACEQSRQSAAFHPD